MFEGGGLKRPRTRLGCSAIREKDCLINGMTVGGGLLNVKCVFSFCLKLCRKTFIQETGEIPS